MKDSGPLLGRVQTRTAIRVSARGNKAPAFAWAAWRPTLRLPALLPPRGTPQRLKLIIGAAVMLLIVLPLAFWGLVWFGLPMDGDEIAQALGEPVRPTLAQRTLLEMGEKVSRGHRYLRRWYPRIAALSEHPSEELRRTAAWFMGQDPSSSAFQHRLAEMLKDPAPLVRRQAALSLAAFRDARAVAPLRAMLSASIITAPLAGPLEYRVLVGDTVRPVTVLARVADTEVHAQVPGRVARLLAPDGSQVTKNQPLIELEPDAEAARQAQRALKQLQARP